MDLAENPDTTEMAYHGGRKERVKSLEL